MARKPANLFYIEVTDTYSGEANYSWVTRHVIRATTLKGAVSKFSRLSGMSWHCVDGYSEQKRYDSQSGACCYFINAYDEERTQNVLRLNTDERETTPHFEVQTTHGSVCVPVDFVTWADEPPTDKIADTLALFVHGDIIGEYPIVDAYISPDWARIAREAYRANTGKEYKGK